MNFGFIAGDVGKDYFVHATGMKLEGDKVSFDVIDGRKGPKADKAEKLLGAITHINGSQGSSSISYVSNNIRLVSAL